MADPAGCLRSSNNYPHVAATALKLALTDVSCSGATTADMYAAQGVTPGPANPAQLSAITASTAAVSLQVGGDNLGFTSILENCIALTPWGPTKVGANCKSYYDPGGHDSLLAAIDALAPTIGTLLQQVHTQAPTAAVFVVGYPAILPQNAPIPPSVHPDPRPAGSSRYRSPGEPATPQPEPQPDNSPNGPHVQARPVAMAPKPPP